MSYEDFRSWEPPTEFKAHDTLIVLVLDGADLEIPNSDKEFKATDTLRVRLTESPTTECYIHTGESLVVKLTGGPPV